MSTDRQTIQTHRQTPLVLPPLPLKLLSMLDYTEPKTSTVSHAISDNAKTKRPRKMKLGTGVPQVTCDSHTDFKVQRAQVKVTGSVGTPQRNVPIFRKRIKLRYSNLARTYDVGSSCPRPQIGH